MKLTKEMVEAMGGQNSEYYNEFRRICYTTYMQLRRHSSVVLHLFSLMVDADIPDIALEPDKTTKKIEVRELVIASRAFSQPFAEPATRIRLRLRLFLKSFTPLMPHFMNIMRKYETFPVIQAEH